MCINNKIGDKVRIPYWLTIMETVWENNHRYQRTNYLVEKKEREGGDDSEGYYTFWKPWVTVIFLALVVISAYISHKAYQGAGTEREVSQQEHW